MGLYQVDVQEPDQSSAHCLITIGTIHIPSSFDYVRTEAKYIIGAVSCPNLLLDLIV